MNTKFAISEVSFVKQKNRRALTLAERIEVIREHERKPNTRHLARLFNCGRTQIQNIIRDKKEYLEEWEKTGDPRRIRRRQSTNLLIVNTIMFEYVSRCLFNLIPLHDKIIKMTGGKLIKLLNINGIRPTNRWLERFKNRYRLKNEDLSSTSFDASLAMQSLKLEDIIKDIKSELKIDELPLHKPTERDIKLLKLYRAKKIESFTKTRTSLSVICKVQTGIGFPDKTDTNMKSETENSTGKQIEFIDLISDSEELELESCNSSYMGESQLTYNTNDENSQSIHIAIENVEDDLDQTITNYNEALKYLKPLEEFSLLKEDLRAVGLINQLENYFKDKSQIEN